MLPKDAGEVALTQSDVNSLTFTLLRMTAITTDWSAVQKDTGVSSSSNAARDFRKVLKKLGLKLSNGKIMEDGDSTAASTPTTPKSPQSTKKCGATATNPDSLKKRKQSDRAGAGEAGDTGEVLKGGLKKLEALNNAWEVIKKEVKDGDNN